jgi:hypothetical protein
MSSRLQTNRMPRLADNGDVRLPTRRVRQRFGWPFWTAVVVAILVAAALIAPRVVEEPLRRRLESDVNRQLKGYRVHIGGLDLQPLALAIELLDTRIEQEAHPKPAVADVPRFRASVQWQAILSGGLVGDVLFERPRIHVNLAQLQKEAKDEVDVQDRGWQAALREIYPLEINEFRVEDGSITYIDAAEDAKPIEMSDVDLVATNVRNVWSPDRTYPSEVDLTANLFGAGEIDVHGRADFLAEPHVGTKVRFALDQVPLSRLEAATRHINASVRGGILSAKGEVEYAPKVKQVHLEMASVDDLKADFLYAKARTGDAEEVVDTVGRSVGDATRAPEVLIDVDEIRMRRSDLGIQNRDADPNYRLFFAVNELAVRDFTNRAGGTRSRLDVDARFMGKGPTRLRATFLPNAKTPDLDLNAAIERTPLVALNPVWKAHAGFDMKGGTFSFYTQLVVRDGHIDGYVKPLLADVDVYDTAQDGDDNVFQQLYEGVVGGVSEIFQDQPRDTIAARTDVSGPVSSPSASTLEILISVLRNAFIDAILPGLERQAGRVKD